MVSLREVPLSGDELTDWVFQELVLTLRKRNVWVKRKKRLMDPDKRQRRSLRGLMQPGIGRGGHGVVITINSAKRSNPNRNAETETLMHETSHAILLETLEWRILKLERILSRRFTREQKEFLKKKFLPRYETK